LSLIIQQLVYIQDNRYLKVAMKNKNKKYGACVFRAPVFLSFGGKILVFQTDVNYLELLMNRLCFDFGYKVYQSDKYIKLQFTITDRFLIKIARGNCSKFSAFPIQNGKTL